MGGFYPLDRHVKELQQILNNIIAKRYLSSQDKKIYHLRAEAGEERELKGQLLVKDLKALQAENKSLVKKFVQSNKA